MLCGENLLNWLKATQHSAFRKAGGWALKVENSPQDVLCSILRRVNRQILITISNSRRWGNQLPERTVREQENYLYGRTVCLEEGKLESRLSSASEPVFAANLLLQ